MSLKEKSMVTLDLAMTIADDCVRADVESFSANLPGNRYDTSRTMSQGEGYKTDDAEIASNLATVVRAMRYIELRAPHLDFVMHRDPEQPHIVWFKGKA